jgi:tetratricopeptide (TPR) repeat protein
MAYAEKKEYRLAAADFEEVIRLAPKEPVGYLNRAKVRAETGDYDGALEDLNDVLRINPRVAMAYYNRGNVWVERKDYGHAKADYEAAIRCSPESPFAYCALAFVLATCPRPEFRDGKRALEYARRGCELSRWQVSGMFASLAAAYAELGNFTEAVKWEEKCLASPKGLPPEVLEKMRERLALYKQGKPYRDK